MEGELLEVYKSLELSEMFEEVLKVGLAHLDEVRANIRRAKGL